MKKQLNILSLALLIAFGAIMTFSVNATDYRRATPTGEVSETPFSKIKRITSVTRGGLKSNNGIFPFSEAGTIPAPAVRSEASKAMAPSRISSSNATLYGVSMAFTGMTYYDQASFGSINVNTGVYTTIQEGSEYYTNDVDFAGGAVRDGILYMPAYQQELDGTIYVNYLLFDARTGDYLRVIPMGQNLLACCYSMTYAEDEDVFYGMAFDAQANPTKFVKVNPNTWEVTEIATNAYNANKGTFIAGIAYDPRDGNIFGIRVAGDIVTIDKETGNIEQWGEIEDESWFVYDGMAQPLVYSPNDHVLLAMTRNQSNGGGDIYAIDTETCEVSYLSTLKGGRFTPVIFCPDQYALDDAPAAPQILSLNHVDAELSGNMEVAVPSLTFNGESISGNVTLKIYIDDEEIYNQSVAPGSTQKIAFETTEGFKVFKAQCSVSDELVGPYDILERYIGNDTPLAPTKVKLSESEITWVAPGAEGVYGGYVDTEAIRYNVYLNDELLTSTPIAETSLAVDLGNKMTAFVASVEAVANGHTSKRADSNELVHGDALVPPVALTPTYAESRLFNIEDKNRDGNEWFYDERQQKWIFYYGYMSTADDWLFLPVINYEDKTKIYELTYTYESYYPYENEFNDMKVCIGKKRNSMYMTNELYKVVDYATILPMTHKIRFAVPEAGEYYIGFYISRNSQGSGIKLSNFTINQLDESANVPGDCENFKIEAAEKGELKALLSWTAPTKSITGEDLDTNEEIIYTITSKAETVTCKALPGAEVTAEVATKQGYNNVSIQPENSNGKGIERIHRLFTGIDTPVSIKEVQSVTAEDNLSMKLTWEPPTEGENGGYIDPENLTYDIYNHYSIYTVKIGSTNKPEYVFAPGSVGMEPYNVGPRAVNSISADEKVYSSDVTYAYDVLGPPYELPMTEYFLSTGTSHWSTYPWNYETTGEYKNSQVEIVPSLENLGVGGKNTQEGSAVIMFGTSSVATKALLSLPKVTTKGHNSVAFKMSFWNQEYAPDMILYGSHYGKEERTPIASIKHTDYPYGQWVDYTVTLPDDYANCGWVHLWLECDIVAADPAYGIFDSFSIYEDVEIDFKIDSMTGTAESIAGSEAQFMAVIENTGSEGASANVVFKIFADGEEVKKLDYPVGHINAGDEVECYVDFLAAPEYIGKDVKVAAYVVSSQDMVPSNNSKEVKWTVNAPVEPVVTDLKAEWTDDETRTQVDLRWSEPDLEYGDYESFETLEDFSHGEKLGQWTNYDEDGKGQFVIGGLSIPDEELPMAWQVINAETLGVMNDDRLCPHSGSKYLLARSIYYDEENEQPIQNADWLISPEIVGGTTLGFWMCTVSTAYTETIELWYSTTDDKPESFTNKVRNFTKSGSEAWEYIEVTLPEDAKYFTLKYTSWGQFGASIDDIAFTPKELLKWDLKHYNVYRNDELIESGLTSLSYSDTNNVSDNNYIYNVTTVVDSNGKEIEGIKSNSAYVWSVNVDDITALEGVAGGKGVIIVTGHAGDELAIYGADGKYINHRNIGSDNVRIASEPGIYLVKVGNAIAKVMVK